MRSININAIMKLCVKEPFIIYLDFVRGREGSREYWASKEDHKTIHAQKVHL